MRTDVRKGREKTTFLDGCIAKRERLRCILVLHELVFLQGVWFFLVFFSFFFFIKPGQGKDIVSSFVFSFFSELYFLFHLCLSL